MIVESIANFINQYLVESKKDSFICTIKQFKYTMDLVIRDKPGMPFDLRYGTLYLGKPQFNLMQTEYLIDLNNPELLSEIKSFIDKIC